MNTEDHATLVAIIRGVDATAREHEREWGADRLPDLIGDDLRAKFYRQQAKWSAAIEAAYETERRPLTPAELETIQTLSEGLRRGWSAMADAAAESGARAIRPEVWEMTLADGSKAALVRSVAEASVLTDDRYVSVWTLDEIVSVIAINLPASIAEAKSVWKEGKVVLKGGPKWNPEGDEVPFGSDDGVVEDAAEAFGKIDIAPKVSKPAGPVDLPAEFG